MKCCGIDEAGRGPVAGPLLMAGVVLHTPIAGLADSKKLSEVRREALFAQIILHSDYHIVRFGADAIDRDGLSLCLRRGLEAIRDALPGHDYLFDGNRTFGAEGIRTMVKADTQIPEVSAASILAKVTRDREMIALAEVHPHYGFERHKGYPTKAHIAAIRACGYCAEHRRSYTIKGL